MTKFQWNVLVFLNLFPIRDIAITVAQMEKPNKQKISNFVFTWSSNKCSCHVSVFRGDCEQRDLCSGEMATEQTVVYLWCWFAAWRWSNLQTVFYCGDVCKWHTYRVTISSSQRSVNTSSYRRWFTLSADLSINNAKLPWETSFQCVSAFVHKCCWILLSIWLRSWGLYGYAYW